MFDLHKTNRCVVIPTTSKLWRRPCLDYFAEYLQTADSQTTNNWLILFHITKAYLSYLILSKEKLLSQWKSSVFVFLLHQRKLLCFSLLTSPKKRYCISVYEDPSWSSSNAVKVLIIHYTTHLACFHWYRRARIMLQHATSFACVVPWMTFYFGELHNKRTHGPFENYVDVHTKRWA